MGSTYVPLLFLYPPISPLFLIYLNLSLLSWFSLTVLCDGVATGGTGGGTRPAEEELEATMRFGGSRS